VLLVLGSRNDVSVTDRGKVCSDCTMYDDVAVMHTSFGFGLDGSLWITVVTHVKFGIDLGMNIHVLCKIVL
jgi:hypothetical protein